MSSKKYSEKRYDTELRSKYTFVSLHIARRTTEEDIGLGVSLAVGITEVIGLSYNDYGRILYDVCIHTI
jgi:hypothetical protein